MDYYDELIERLQVVYNFDDAEKLFNTLAVIIELMIQIKDSRLSGAELYRQFVHDRLKLKVFLSRKLY
jgi:hypothetical protein